jgi:hypothetical protein
MIGGELLSEVAPIDAAKPPCLSLSRNQSFGAGIAIGHEEICLMKKTLYKYIFQETWPPLLCSIAVFMFIVLAVRIVNIQERFVPVQET